MSTFVIWRGPLRWRRLYYGDETAIPHAYSNHSPASVCELNGWSLVRECHGDVAIVRDCNDASAQPDRDQSPTETE